MSRLWRRLNQTGSAQERSISGRAYITTPAQDQYISEYSIYVIATVTATATAADMPCLRIICGDVSAGQGPTPYSKDNSGFPSQNNITVLP